MKARTFFAFLPLPVAFVTMLVLAVKGYDFVLTDFLDGLIDWYESTLGQLVEELHIKERFEELARSLGFHVELQPHWKHVFILMWLFLSRYAGGSSEGQPVRLWFMRVWAFVCAFGAGLMAGSDFYDRSAVFLWPVAGFFLFVSGALGWGVASGQAGSRRSRLLLLACLALFVGAGYFAWSGAWLRYTWEMSEYYRSPGLTALVVAALALAVLLFVAGLPGGSERTGSLLERLAANPGRRVGGELLGVFSFVVLALVVLPAFQRTPDKIEPFAVGDPSRNTFRECAHLDDHEACLDMVRIAATGAFQTADDGGGKPGPAVAVGAFRISRTEITVAQFAEFLNDSGQGTRKPSSTLCKWTRGSWPPGSENLPATCITWADADAYARWLSRKSGRAYRLPTAAEWQYAASEGAVFEVPWGSDQKAACKFGNFWSLSGPCVGADPYDRTAPVGSFGESSKHLADMWGNVREWTEDCPYSAQGAAASWSLERLLGPQCARRLRGGGWYGIPDDARFANRDGYLISYVDDGAGFRVARTD